MVFYFHFKDNMIFSSLDTNKNELMIKKDDKQMMYWERSKNL